MPAARFAFLLMFYLFCSCCLYLICLVNQSRTKGERWLSANYFKPSSNSIAGRSGLVLLVILDVVYCYLLLFLLHKNIGKVDV